jgi:1,4-dihydroxy-6-naphthoate synthase
MTHARAPKQPSRPAGPGRRHSIAFSPCPNDTFVFHAWAHGLVPDAPPIDVTYADIDVANGLAARGELDVVKISYAALPWALDHYALLPSGGAVGRGCGPLVLVRPGSSSGASRLDGGVVAIPGERSTAYLLFRLWAAAAGVRCSVRVLPFPEIMPAVRAGTVDAGLVIHEARFTYASQGLAALVDLGAWWEDDTGLPIPLGAIVARRGMDLDALAGAARASVEHAWAHPEASRGYIAAHAQEMDPEVQARHIATYVTEFTRELGEEGYAAVRALLGRAADAGLVPRSRL